MKKHLYFIFLCFLLFYGSGFASESTTMSIGNTTNNKVMLKLTRPCIIKELEEDKQETIVEDNKENEVTNLIDDIIKNDSETEDEKKEDKSEEKSFKPNKIYSNYNSPKNNDLFFDIYNKIIENLYITELYEIDYDYNFCNEVMDFFKENDSNNVDEYIFSNSSSNGYILSGDIIVNNENELKLQLFLWDVLDEKFLDGKYYIIDLLNVDVDKIANTVSDFIFQKTMGESRGMFNSRIIYISETGGVKNRTKQVSIMNFDGSKNTKITSGSSLKLTPIFSRYNPNEIFYLNYTDEGVFVFKYDLKNKTTTRISLSGQEMTSAAAFNPNGENQLIVSGSQDSGGTNLFLFDLNKKTNRKLTNNKSINTSASFSPDGKKIVYVSSKNGSRKLYVMDLETSEEKMVSNGAGLYDKPSWSPDGRMISFVKILGGKFYVGVMTTEGEWERILTGAYLVEGVKWSPNSRYIIYTKQDGPYGKKSIPKLYIMDVLTRTEYKLNTPENEGASDPDWIMNF